MIYIATIITGGLGKLPFISENDIPGISKTFWLITLGVLVGGIIIWRNEKMTLLSNESRKRKGGTSKDINALAIWALALTILIILLCLAVWKKKRTYTELHKQVHRNTYQNVKQDTRLDALEKILKTSL